MKKYLLTSLLLLLSVVTIAHDSDIEMLSNSPQTRTDSLSQRLQDEEDEAMYKKIWSGRTFWNLGYEWGKLNDVDFNEKYNSQVAFALSIGRVIYVHKKPVANMIKFGIDAGLDVSYAKFKEKDRGIYDSDLFYDKSDKDKNDYSSIGLHSVDIGFAIGPSITINPVGKLKVKTFFHVVPSGSLIIADGDAHSSYKTTFTYGGEIVWSRIGIGVEGYTGAAKYKNVIDEDENDHPVYSKIDYNAVGKTKFRTSGFRLYLALKL